MARRSRASSIPPGPGRLTNGTTTNWLVPDLHGNVGLTLSGAASTVAHATRYDPYGIALGTGQAAGTAKVGEDLWKFQSLLDLAHAVKNRGPRPIITS